MQGLPQIGDVLDDTYKIEKLIGTGGFGAVYLARQLSMDREVALKILVANAMNVDEMIQRFRREVMACRSLGHPNTIRIYDFRDRPDGILYYTMEYVNGPTLKDLIKENGPLPPSRVAHILKQICKSLAEAHSYGIVHRDLKPANIMLAPIAGETDFVKVVDFGIAKIVDDGEERDQLTNAGVLVGTLNYMSPEQIQGGDITPASDLYALGLIAIEMLMGRSVFEGTGRWEILHKQISDEPVDIPQEVLESRLGDVLRMSLNKRATDRFTKAEDMLKALNGVSSLSDAPLLELQELGVVEMEPVVEESPSASLPMPEAIPVESEPPLPEAVRPQKDTPRLNVSPDSTFDDAPTAMHDSGVSENPLRATARAQVQKYEGLGNQGSEAEAAAPAPNPVPAPTPVSVPTPAAPPAMDEPSQADDFATSGDTDMGPGPAPKSNTGLIAIAVVVLLLVAVAGIAVTQMGSGDEVPEVPPVVAQVPVNPTEPVAQVEQPEVPEQPEQPEVPEEPEVPVKMKTIRLDTGSVRAQVYDGSELVGDTPLRFPVGKEKVFTLKADGYADASVTLSNQSEASVAVELERIGGSKPADTKTTPTTTKTEKKDPKKDDGWVDISKPDKKKPDVPVF